MEFLLRLGKWLVNGHKQFSVEDERRRTLLALQMLHFIVYGVAWLLFIIVFFDPYTPEEEEEITFISSSSSSASNSSSSSSFFGLGGLLGVLDRLNSTQHVPMLVLNTLAAILMLGLLRAQVQLGLVVAIWVTYIQIHAVYYSINYPNLGADKWFLVVPLQVFFSLGSAHGTLSLLLSFVLQMVVIHVRMHLPITALIRDTPASVIPSITHITSVGLLCSGYEHLRTYALARMEHALHETECANAKLKKANKAKEQFLANVSHELRTPMHGILATLEELMHNVKIQKHPQVREAVNLIADCSDHLCTLINDILDFQTIGTEKIRLEHIPFDLSENIEQVCQAVASTVRGKQLVFEKNVNILHRLRSGDPRRIRQIIYNLLNNGFKFTPEGGTVRLDVNEGSSSSELIIIRISDTGIGMSQEFLSKIFLGFYQGDSSLRRKYGGTGLGLVISKRLAEAMGGGIKCESKPGVGSTFVLTINLPLASAQCRQPVRTNSGRVLRRSSSSSEILPVIDLTVSNGALVRSGQSRDASGPAKGVPNDNSTDVDNAALYEDQTVISPPRAHKDINQEENTDEQADKMAQPAATNSFLQEQHSGITHPTSSSSSGTHDLKGKAILLVEDNIVNQKVGARMLQTLGCDVVITANGLEAVHAIEQHYNTSDQDDKEGFGKERMNHRNIDLVLMDCQMPVMDGFKATERIRQLEQQLGEQHGESPHIPILALTASATADYRQRCFRTGMDDFLAKPLNKAALEEMLRKWLIESSVESQVN